MDVVAEQAELGEVQTWGKQTQTMLESLRRIYKTLISADKCPDTGCLSSVSSG